MTQQNDASMEVFRFSNREEYIRALDAVMPEEYFNYRDVPNMGKIPYLPIPIQQALADDLFHYWNVTDESYQMIANELICTVRLTYMPGYPDAPELFCTGSSSQAIQMDQGAKPNEVLTKKKTNALEYVLPSAKSRAVGNALEGLGNIFGRNLGRKISKEKTLSPDFKIRVHGNVQAK